MLHSSRKFITTSAILLAMAFGSAHAADPRSGSMLGNTCAGCHGTDGASAGLTMPNIAGLDKSYLEKSMIDFKYGVRPATIMDRIARGYTDQEIKTIAGFFSRKPLAGNTAQIDKSVLETGKQIHRKQCNSCHKNNGAYNENGVPALTGQWPDYLYTMLRDLHDIDSPTPQPKKMRDRVQRLTGDDIRALSHYYSSQR